MSRLAREALDQDGLSRHSPGTGKPGPGASLVDWNHAPNDRLAARDMQLRLARTLEIDIIPRLVKVHRAAPAEPAVDYGGVPRPSAQDVEDFVQLVLAREQVPAQAFIEVLRQRGMSVETVYLDLLAPATQHLSYLWAQDLCEFTQVTLGLARMQKLLHELSPGLDGQPECRSNARRVLLMPARGEHQTFGLSMVGEFFHRAGWEVDCGGGPSHADAVQCVASDWFDVVGLCAGSDTSLESLKAFVLELRSRSRNKQIVVLVGGPIFAGHAERVKFVGADACGLDGKQAPVQAERLIGRHVRGR
jgi:MerR family transcriptional regulator, light-induced transcriptional regulator